MNFFQEVDFAVDDLSVTKERSEVVDFITPFWIECVSLAIKTPEENNLTIYVRVFSVCNLCPLFGVIRREPYSLRSGNIVLIWVKKNKLKTKCYPEWEWNWGLCLTSDSKSNTILSQLILHVLPRGSLNFCLCAT